MNIKGDIFVKYAAFPFFPGAPPLVFPGTFSNGTPLKTQDVTSFAVNCPAFITAAARCLGSTGCQAAVARGAGRRSHNSFFTPYELKSDTSLPLKLRSLKLTASSPLKMMVSNRNLLFKGSIFKGYVSFREGVLLCIRHLLNWQFYL